MNKNRTKDIFGKLLIIITAICFVLFACSVDSIFDSGFTQVTGIMTAILIGVCFITQRNRHCELEDRIDQDKQR